jgi:membrane protease YdiL (CAAX protease family)
MRNLRRDLTWIGLAYVAYLVVSALSQTGTAMITSWLIPWIGQDAWMVLCIIFMYPLALFLYWLILQTVPKARQNWTYPMGVGRFLGWFVICMGGVYFGNLIGQFLMAVVSAITGQPMANQVEEMIMDMSLWAVILSAVILAPIMEELIFRKLVLDRLAGYGPAVVCVCAGLWSCPRQFLPVFLRIFTGIDICLYLFAYWKSPLQHDASYDGQLLRKRDSDPDYAGGR